MSNAIKLEVEFLFIISSPAECIRLEVDIKWPWKCHRLHIITSSRPGVMGFNSGIFPTIATLHV